MVEVGEVMFSFQQVKMTVLTVMTVSYLERLYSDLIF